MSRNLYWVNMYITIKLRNKYSWRFCPYAIFVLVSLTGSFCRLLLTQLSSINKQKSQKFLPYASKTFALVAKMYSLTGTDTCTYNALIQIAIQKYLYLVQPKAAFR